MTSRRQTFWATLIFGLAVSAVALAAGFAMHNAEAADKTYKWVDDKGVVHYTDKPPIEANNREQTVLDKQARPVQKIDAVPEYQRPSDEEMERQRAEQQKKDIAERKDRALLLSFTTEKDIDFARDRALLALDSQISSSQALLVQQQARHKELLERQETGAALPEGELEKLEDEITQTNANIGRDKKEKETTYAKFERDKQRWRELKAAEKAKADGAAAATK